MYKAYPSGQKMRFGELPYNDICLDKSVFDIGNLAAHTGYYPRFSFEETVSVLHEHLLSGTGEGNLR